MRNSYIVTIHVVFWFIVLSLNYSFFIFRGSDVPLENYILVTIKTALEAGDLYIYYLIIVPRFFITGKYVRFLFISIIYALVYIPFYAAVITSSDILLNLAENWKGYSFELVVATYYVIFYIILGGLFKLAIDGIESRQQKLRLEKLNVKNELALLRTQINPHFLFNTLNTIHSFIISNNSNSAKAVIKLSDIMRYMLYDAGKDKITLEQELEYLRSYISLQDFRLEKKGLVEFNINGSPEGILIPPMLLTPFVENVFKHGKTRDTRSGIKINLDVTNTSMLFNISNYYDLDKSPEIKQSQGVGLKNVRRRLELLFPEKHSLVITKKEGKFMVHLNIAFV
jgi:two-component system, LytTR family, sensor kinase